MFSRCMQPCLNVVRSNVNCIRKKLRPFVGVDPTKAAFIEPFSLHSCQQLYFFSIYSSRYTCFLIKVLIYVDEYFYGRKPVLKPAADRRSRTSLNFTNCHVSKKCKLHQKNPHEFGEFKPATAGFEVQFFNKWIYSLSQLSDAVLKFTVECSGRVRAPVTLF